MLSIPRHRERPTFATSVSASRPLYRPHLCSGIRSISSRVSVQILWRPWLIMTRTNVSTAYPHISPLIDSQLVTRIERLHTSCDLMHVFFFFDPYPHLVNKGAVRELADIVMEASRNPDEVCRRRHRSLVVRTTFFSVSFSYCIGLCSRYW
jgi:hypothetical protein